VKKTWLPLRAFCQEQFCYSLTGKLGTVYHSGQQAINKANNQLGLKLAFTLAGTSTTPLEKP